jgi:Zn finger protein HypA/HybF involved in hydrogenase expression
MHEYSIISSLVDRVTQEAVSRSARPVQLYVAIGEMAGVDVNLLLTAYDTFRERTICERAGLHVRQVAAEWRCPTCDVVIEKGALLRCRVRERTICGRAGLHVRQVAAEWRCPKCDVVIEKGALLRCRGCGRPARLVQGDEIVLERIEMEVPDVQ